MWRSVGCFYPTPQTVICTCAQLNELPSNKSTMVFGKFWNVPRKLEGTFRLSLFMRSQMKQNKSFMYIFVLIDTNSILNKTTRCFSFCYTFVVYS